MADFVYVNREYEDEIRRHGLLSLQTLLGWSDGEHVSSHGPREVWRISLPGRPRDDVFYLRKEHIVPWGQAASQLTRLRQPTSRCLAAVRAASWLDQGELDTTHMVCLVERQCFGKPTKAAGIFTAVPGKDLYGQLLVYGRAHQRATNDRARVKLLYELGEFIAQFHQTGLSWPDFVAKHVYVKYLGQADPRKPWWRFGLIDIENMRPGASAKERNRQFDRFLRSIEGLLTATDVLRIMIGYIGLQRITSRTVRRRLLGRFFPNGLRRIKRAVRQQRLLRSYPKDRPLQEEELYERIGGVTVNTRFVDLLEKLDLPHLSDILTYAAGSELYKPGLGRRVRYRFEARSESGRPVWLYLKRTRYPRLIDQLDRLCCGTLRHSSCWHERQIIKHLSELRIPTPVVVAYGEKMFFGLERRSALITEGIVGQSLERFVPKHFARPARGEELRQRRAWIRQLATLVRRFHLAGYCHRDLYLSHIFIGFEQDGRAIFYLIDLARCFKMGIRRNRWIVKDLASLNYSAGAAISRSDRLRFFLTYRNVDYLCSESKRLIGRIVAKSNKIARHQRRRQRVTVERPYENSPDHRTT